MKSLLENLGDEVTEAPSAFRKSLAGAGSPGDCSQGSQWPGMPPAWVTHRMTGHLCQSHRSGCGSTSLQPSGLTRETNLESCQQGF